MEDANLSIIQNGGPIADRLLASGFDVNVLRPYIDEQGAFITNSAEQVLPVTNATLRKDEWIFLDKVVTEEAQLRLQAVGDLQRRGLTMSLPNAMGKTVMQYQNQSDISDASISMDGIRRGNNDRPQYDLTSLPLPIIHKDFSFTARELNASRNEGTPIDDSTASLATRKVSEFAEKLLIGTASSFVFGGGTVYGYENFTYRTSSTFADWNASGKTGAQCLVDIQNMVEAARTDRHYGPFVLYVSANMEAKLEEDFKDNSDLTIRDRLLKLDKIAEIKTLDFMSDDTLLLVEMDKSTVREIVGFNPTVVQWQSEGGMLYNFKVMAILVPNLRADYQSRCGIVHYVKA